MCVALVTARSLWFRQVQHSSHRFALALRRPVFSRRGGTFRASDRVPLPDGSNRLEIVRSRLPKKARDPMSQLKGSRTSPIVRAKPSSRPAEPQNPRGDRPSGNCCIDVDTHELLGPRPRIGLDDSIQRLAEPSHVLVREPELRDDESLLLITGGFLFGEHRATSLSGW